MVRSSVFFPSYFTCFSCQTAGHDYEKAIMICLTEHITESAFNQQNEFQSKWRDWHSTSHSNKRWYVNPPQIHCSLYIHHSFSGSGGPQQSCCHWQRKYGRNKHDFHQKVHRSVGSGSSIKYLACNSPCGELSLCHTVQLISNYGYSYNKSTTTTTTRRHRRN